MQQHLPAAVTTNGDERMRCFRLSLGFFVYATEQPVDLVRVLTKSRKPGACRSRSLNQFRFGFV